MYQQKQKELLKQYEKQEKKLKELKAGGKSTKQAVSTTSTLLLTVQGVFGTSSKNSILGSIQISPFSLQEKQTKEALTRKQQKCRRKNQDEESQEAPELLKRPKEYTVRFTFPNPPPLSPPVLGLHGKYYTPPTGSTSVCTQPPPKQGPFFSSEARTFRVTFTVTERSINCFIS